MTATDGDGDSASTPPDVGLVVVTNREPYVHDQREGERHVQRPIGGLTAAMDAVMCTLGGTWVAWGSGDADFTVTDAHDCVAVPPGAEQYTLRRVALSDREYANYYAGYSNQVLWPLCHQYVDRIRVGADHWESYRTVNERFADAAVAALDRTDHPTPLLWTHDYHLALVPRLVRRRTDGSVPIQHFWHIPWPPASLFERCPHTDRLLAGLLGSDRIGFHTEAYARQFLETVRACLPGATVDHDDGRVAFDGRTVDVFVAPVGIDVAGVRDRATGADAERFWQRLRADHGIGADERVAVSVDRLDYTKGILQRLDAVEHLLSTDESLRGSFRLVQKGTPTRTEIPAYRRYQAQVFERIDEVNERFGTADWQPVTYIDGRYTPVQVASLLRHADVGLVTPVVDGYNLVAQEYVAAQDAGALVLSRFAGVHTLLGDDAYSVNPHDVPAFADRLRAALTAPEAERTDRLQRLSERVAANDIRRWIRRSLSPWTERE